MSSAGSPPGVENAGPAEKENGVGKDLDVADSASELADRTTAGGCSGDSPRPGRRGTAAPTGMMSFEALPAAAPPRPGRPAASRVGSPARRRHGQGCSAVTGSPAAAEFWAKRAGPWCPGDSSTPRRAIRQVRPRSGSATQAQSANRSRRLAGSPPPSRSVLQITSPARRYRLSKRGTAVQRRHRDGRVDLTLVTDERLRWTGCSRRAGARDRPLDPTPRPPSSTSWSRRAISGAARTPSLHRNRPQVGDVIDDQDVRAGLSRRSICRQGVDHGPRRDRAQPPLPKPAGESA